VAPQEIAIIYKEHRSGEELARYFQLKDIAVNTKKKVNILTEPFGKKIINLLRYVAAEQQFPYSGDGLLFELMHYDFYQIEPMDIAKFSVEVSKQNHDAKERTSIRRKLYELARKPEAELNTESLKQIQRLSNDLEYWIKEAANLTLHNLFEKMMVRGGLLAYVLQSADKTWLMQMLTSIFNFLKDESRKKPDLSLVEFVGLLDSLEEHDLPLSLTQAIFNETGVHFLTCHSSKGLEFDYVFLVGANRNVWEQKRKNTSGEYKLPDTVFSSLANTSDLEELRRLFYVAITRARKELAVYLQTE
jgi:DNA helicase-2/ATP-dependent DNA helicase PcrA